MSEKDRNKEKEGGVVRKQKVYKIIALLIIDE